MFYNSFNTEILIVIYHRYIYLIKYPTTSYFDVAQSSALARFLILRVVLLIGNIQIWLRYALDTDTSSNLL